MPIRKIKAGLVLTKDVDEFIGEPGYIFYDVDTNGDLTLRLSDGVTPGGVNMSSGGGSTSRLNVVGDDSSGSLLNLASGTPDLKFTGTGGVTVSVADDVVTIDGSGVSGSGGGTLSVFGDDSTNMEVDLATQDLQVSGGNSITTSTSSTQTLTVSLDNNITINSISSTDSTSIQVNDGLNVSGTLSANTIDTNLLQSGDSTNIRVADNLVPAADATYNLGSPDRRWQSLYVTGSTIFLNETKLQIDNQGDFIVKDVSENLKRVIAAELEIGTGDNKIKIKKDDTTGVVSFLDENNTPVRILSVVGDDSTGSELFSGESIKIQGGDNVSVTVEEDSTRGFAVVKIDSNPTIAVDTITAGDSATTAFNSPVIFASSVKFDGDAQAITQILDEDNMASNSATALATQQSIKAYIDSASGINDATELQLGTPTDSSTSPVGAISTLTPTRTVTDSIDDLNEALENVRNNTFVKSVDFTANTTSGGAGTAVTLTISVTGNANRYDITWGDGDTTIGTTDSTPTHTYATNSGSPFDVTVRAYNNGGQGTGSEATATKSNYITIYTATPVVSFDLYRAASGGSALSGNNLYVIEGNSLYMDNNTTNIGAATVDYTMAWGDGSADSDIANDSAAGGTAGTRLQHTWADATSSGTGRDTLTLTLNNHSTALPADIPATGSVTLKVYDDAIAAPNGLSSKTLPAVSSVGTSPKLASGFTDNTGGATISAGDTVNRVTSGTAEAGPITTFAYNASSGTLTANVNASGDGNRTLTSGDDSGTYTSLVITSESDYNLLDATGASTTFAASIYHPDLYKGFKAKVSKSVAGLSTGANSFQLSHSVTGSTNTVEFVKDDLTATPTVNVGSASLTENVAGTYRYISGIPYYNSGSPTLTLAGVTIDDLVGQCYTNQSNIVEVDDGTNLEGTSSNAITNSDYTYANIDGASTMLSGGIPTVNVGTASAYAIGSLTVPITSSSVRTVSRIKVRARNVNGVGSYSSDIATNIAVHTAAQSGINETAVAVSDSLGAGFNDDAVRIFDFSSATTDTPTYNNSTNFYTNNTYSESSDPGVAGTKEATVRLGVIKYDVTDYSTGYLPAGPDRSADTGTQYYTMAFRRTTMSNFTITLTGTVSGVFIAAPGTAIDSASTLNGWLDAGVTYGGSGVPGADTGNGGNGSNGCAFTSGDRIIDNTSYSSSSFTLTLGSENGTNATGNVVLVRFKLNSGDSISAVSIA